jgi:hypothetical protein
LAFIGHSISDDDLVMAILNGLGPEYNSFVISITTAHQHQSLNFSALHGTLLTLNLESKDKTPMALSHP